MLLEQNMNCLKCSNKTVHFSSPNLIQVTGSFWGGSADTPYLSSPPNQRGKFQHTATKLMMVEPRGPRRDKEEHKEENQEKHKEENKEENKGESEKENQEGILPPLEE
tara:strand:- start:1335 stop:1658 length:324 start_codon:yes stop_codon:yes gene_type:complete